MVSLASSLNPLQDRNTGFVPREMYDAETGYVFSLTRDLVCISFHELTLFKQRVGHTPFQGFQL